MLFVHLMPPTQIKKSAFFQLRTSANGLYILILGAQLLLQEVHIRIVYGLSFLCNCKLRCSFLAVDYPIDKVSCYVSDDGAAMHSF